ncbi:MAG TPA: ATP-binding protein [Cyclobacteriaceae bacterium]|nr:ATP-binding protein [Cyclobacteriaceae bacterium]
MKFHFKKKVWISFLVALAILAGLWYYSILNNQEFAETSRMVSRTNEVLYHIERSRSGALETDKSLLQYLVTGDTNFYHRYNNQVDSIRIHYLKLRDLTHDNVMQQAYIDSMRFWGRQKYERDLATMETRKSSTVPFQLINQSLETNQLLANFTNTTTKMRSIEERLLSERIKQNEQNLLKFNITFSILIASTVIILVIVFISINRTVRARLEAETKMDQINNELEAFTYSVSHDLRAPLRSINGYAQILEDDYSGKLDPEGSRVIQVIRRNARRMGKLIDDLLDFSRLGKKELSRSDINMTQLVGDLLNEFKDAEQNRIIEFQVNTLHDAKGDIDMIRQVWTNLLSNAIKYSGKKPLSRIEVGSSLGRGTVQYFVKDNGVGFDMQYASKLFNVFQRLHKLQDFDGTGVGLAIVSRIVSRHGGNVRVEATPGEGATFYFSLPN